MIATNSTGNIYFVKEGASSPYTLYRATTQLATITWSTNTKPLIKFSPDGDVLWSAAIPALLPKGLISDDNDNVYSYGMFPTTGRTFYNTDGTTGAVAPTTARYYTAKYSSVGTVVWVVSFGQFNVMNVSVDSLGDVYIGGDNSTSAGTLYNFDGQIAKTLTARTTANSWLAKYSSSGVLLWVTRFDSTSGGSSPGGVSADTSRNVYCQGTIYGPDLKFNRPE
jgi:hypothetical protein